MKCFTLFIMYNFSTTMDYVARVDELFSNVWNWISDKSQTM